MQSLGVTPSSLKKESTSENSSDAVEENGPVKKLKLEAEDYPTQILANHTGTPRKYQTILDRPSSLIQPVSIVRQLY